MIVVDGKGKIFGRLASKVSKMALLGQEVALVNAQEIIMSGNLQTAKEDYLLQLTQKHKADPTHSPKWPRVPYMFVKRLIRGMLPYKSQRGRDAFKRIRAYNDFPESLKKEAIKEFPSFDGSGQKKQFSILALCRELGYKN